MSEQTDLPAPKQSGADFDRRSTIIGIVVMMVAVCLFAASDTLGKWLVTDTDEMGGFSVGQVLLVRSIGAFFILGPFFARQGWRVFFSSPRPLLQAARILCASLEALLFYTAIALMPLADLLTFYMATPIYVAVLGHFLLGETMHWRRWLATIIGFVGVIIILRPSANMFSPAAIAAILCSIFYALFIILNRVLRQVPDIVLVGWQTIVTLILGSVMIVTVEPWQSPSTNEWIGLLAIGILACVSHMLTARSLKMAPASVLAPLQYMMLLWGIIFGIIFFQHYPDAIMLVGAAIIVLAGLFIFHRKKIVTNKIPKTDVGKIGR